MTDEIKTDGTNKAKQMKTDLQIIQEVTGLTELEIKKKIEEPFDDMSLIVDIMTMLELARQDERSKLKEVLQAAEDVMMFFEPSTGKPVDGFALRDRAKKLTSLIEKLKG